jgi:dTDP-4-dehydrorhamnose reductase
MRILLTGISGQVGSALRSSLCSGGIVIAVDRSSLDLSRPERLMKTLDQLSPDLIVNPAAYTAVDKAEDESELAFRVNAEAPGIMAKWAEAHGVPMVQFSTDYVFDGSGERPWREDDLVAPLSIYGESKLAGEIAVKEAGGSHLIIRTSWVFAAMGKNFLTTIVRIARDKSELRIVADQIGAPTSARTIAQALALILGDPSQKGFDTDLIKRRFNDAEGILHLSNCGETSFYGFACAIVDGLRRRGFQLAVRDIIAIASQDYPTKAQRPLNSRLDMTSLEQTFGIRTLDWREALEVELDELSIELEKDAFLRDRCNLRPPSRLASRTSDDR